jgi:soluble lytic murein transglycosylase
MTMLGCWAPIIRVRWYRLAAAAGVVLLSAAALPAETLEALVRAYRDKPAVAARSALQRHIAAEKNRDKAALGWLALGLVELEKERHAEALEALEKARVGKLEDYAAIGAGRAMFFLGRKQEAAKRLEGVMARQPVSPQRAQAILLTAQAYLDTGEAGRAAELLRRFWGELPGASAGLLYGQSLEAAGSTSAAAVQLQKVYYEFPLTEEARKAEPLLAQLAAKLGPAYPPVMGNAMLGRASKLMDAGQAKMAAAELAAMVEKLGGAERDLAKVRVGVARFKDGDNAAALRYLQGLEVSAAEADAERLHYVFASARRLGRMEEGRQALSDLDAKYRQSPWRMETLIALGNHFLVENDTAGYEPLYGACAETFPQAPRSAYCHWKVAWLHYRERRGSARQMLREHLERFAGSDQAPAALYFLGRLAEGDGDYASAKELYTAVIARYPNYYYAVVARQRLGERAVGGAGSSPATAAWLRSLALNPAQASGDFTMDAATRLRVERGRLLASAGLWEMAETELRFGARTDAKAGPVAIELAQVASRRGSTYQGIRYIKSVSPGYLNWDLDGAPEQFWRLAYPMPYRAALEKYSGKNELDPLVMAALIRQESEFDPKAVSRAKAVGLTQILPSTGREISRKLGLRYRSSMLTQPDTNLQMGTYYLKRMLDSLGGQWEATLAAYNAGKSRAVKWMSWGEFREPSEFIETIPFTETRHYVQTVLRNADIYRRLYGNRPGASGSQRARANP